MGDVTGLLGLPLAEAVAQADEWGLAFRVVRTGEIGRSKAVRRQERDGLELAGERVVRVRRDGETVELLVTPAFRRPLTPGR
ncbi:MAG: hypothetical protein ACM3RP_02675 [Chitinophagales bacterium]